MKTYNNLFEQVISKENIEASIYEAALGKSARDKKEAYRVLENPKKHIEKLYKILSSEDYHFSQGDLFTINEHSPTKKVRQIKKPRFIYDQIVHHCIIRVLKGIILHSLYYHAYGSLPDRGIHKVATYLHKWLKNDFENSCYCFQGDFHHYYENVDKDVLKENLFRMFYKDKRLLKLLYKSIDAHPESGIPLGFYTSVWYAMIYAMRFDHFIEDIKGDVHYIRFMDDIIFLSGNKEDLHRIKNEAKDYLKENLKLDLKPNWQIFPIARLIKEDKENHKNDIIYGKDLDFLGFRFYQYKTTLRKTNFASLMSSARSIERLQKKSMEVGRNLVTFHDAASLVSKLGMLSHTNGYTILQEIKKMVDLTNTNAIIKRNSQNFETYKELQMTHNFADRLLAGVDDKMIDPSVLWYF